MKAEILILGGGLTGLSTSFHCGHDRCLIVEEKSHAGGHIHSENINGFTWDEGPHVSFTKHQYVKELFEKSLEGNFLEFPVHPTNYYKGHWIPHPAQSNLWAVPEPLRSQCLDDFLAARESEAKTEESEDYQQWLESAFGKTFAEHFPAIYTEKYWTLPPAELGTTWLGNRVYNPNPEVVKRGFQGPQEEQTHYITSIRYPERGGYYSYASLFEDNANMSLNEKVTEIDLEKKTVLTEKNNRITYNKLVSTIALPEFVSLCNAPGEIVAEADKLKCSQLLILNFEINHAALRTEQWLYVYDKEMLSTRINFTELLSPNNAPQGKCGIQVEVYYSVARRFDGNVEEVKNIVSKELVKMGLVKDILSIEAIQTKWIPYANVIFDHEYEDAMKNVLNWLGEFGLKREYEDLQPMTDWDNIEAQQLGDIILAGRFGQWKYFWTDDCVLRGKFISENL